MNQPHYYLGHDPAPGPDKYVTALFERVGASFRFAGVAAQQTAASLRKLARRLKRTRQFQPRSRKQRLRQRRLARRRGHYFSSRRTGKSHYTHWLMKHCGLDLKAHIAPSPTMQLHAEKVTDIAFAQVAAGQWRTEFLCQPAAETAAERELRRLAESYHRRTETFDRVHCSGTSKRGVAIPANGYELSVINRHAREVFDELCDQAAALGFTPKQFRDAITNHPKQ